MDSVRFFGLLLNNLKFVFLKSIESLGSCLEPESLQACLIKKIKTELFAWVQNKVNRLKTWQVSR